MLYELGLCLLFVRMISLREGSQRQQEVCRLGSAHVVTRGLRSCTALVKREVVPLRSRLFSSIVFWMTRGFSGINVQNIFSTFNKSNTSSLVTYIHGGHPPLLGQLVLAFLLFWIHLVKFLPYCDWDMYIDHGMFGFPYLFRTALVAIVYFSSESISNPSMSKRHARTGGKLFRLISKDPPSKWL